MNCYHLLAAVAALLTIEPVLAVEMPCPVPGLEEVVDTLVVDKPFSATAQDRESMSFLRLRREDSSNNSNQ